MPYSTQFEQQLREIMQDQLKMVSFENLADIELFLNVLNKTIKNQTLQNDEKSTKYNNEIQEILDMINSFDLYAGENIIDKINYVTTTTNYSPAVPIKVFMPKEEKTNISRENLITEATEEFKNIMISTVEQYILDMQSLDNDKRTDLIKNLNDK